MTQQQISSAIQSVAHCTWCDAPIDRENSLSEFCDDCVKVDDKQDDAAYWRHINQKIDEARGK